MKQRVAIIRSLINDSKSLLMDETFSALDVHTKHKLQEQVHKICREENKTIIFVTHDIDEAVFLSDEIVVFSRRPGRIKKIFEIEEIFFLAICPSLNLFNPKKTGISFFLQFSKISKIL